jgi:hypothetical protein
MMAVGRYIEKINEIYPDEEIINYLHFMGRKKKFWLWLFVFNAALVGAFSYRQIMIFQTESGKFIIAEVGLLGSFMEPEIVSALEFKSVGKLWQRKTKVELLGINKYNGIYKLMSTYNTNGKSKHELINMLINGQYDY